MFRNHFRRLYRRTMNEAYALATEEIYRSLRGGGKCLDCGAYEGKWYERLSKEVDLDRSRYFGVEWNRECVERARERGLNMAHGDLNMRIPYEAGTFRCVFALSVLEHLLKGCSFLKECHRVLEGGGQLVLLTPNISTYFTALLILLGKMPSSGPHPDSESLMKDEEVIKVSSENLQWDCESGNPVHRHLVVFSYRVLKKYLKMLGFAEVRGYGFGLYPFPVFMQPALERIDPYHCHQMVFVARK